MSATLEAYIESVSNPAGRFRTLENIWAMTDSNGLPLFSVHGAAVSFIVSHNDQTWTMRCPLGNENPISPEMQNRMTDISNRNNPHIAACKLYNNELLTFNSDGTSSRSDIILCARPEGIPLSGFIRKHLFCSDKTPMRSLLRGIYTMSQSLYNSNLVHGNLKDYNIYVNPDNLPIGIDFAASNEPHEDKDTMALALLGTSAYILASEPELLHITNELYFTAKYIRKITAQAEFLNIAPLLDMMTVLTKLKNGTQVAREEVNNALKTLSETPFIPLPLLTNILASTATEYDDEEPLIMVCKDYCDELEEDTTLRVDFSTCDFVGTISDTLIRFCNNGVWGYADRQGRRISNEEYTSAEDFYEGRAKICMNGQFGLIDREGNYIIAPLHEDLEWHGKQNVAAVCTDGEWQLYDRSGKAITDKTFDWLSLPSEGVFVAKRGSKYGFISATGKQITDFRFDEAFTPQNNKALVAIGDKSFHIDISE